MREKYSLGGYFKNEGTKNDIKVEKFETDRSRCFYLFDVIPMGAVRMNRADAWKKRDVVVRYFAYKDILRLQAKAMNFELGKVFDAVYFLPMPNSWSEKKKERMNGMPCEVKPDTDNITKGLKDTFLKNDSMVWYEKAEKRWAYKGSILIYE